MPCLSREICEHVRMDYDSLGAVSSGLGTGGLIVVGKTTDFVELIRRAALFFKNESCGECAVCREGSRLIYDLLDLISTGKGKRTDIDVLERLCEETSDTALCPVGVSGVRFISGFLRHFRFLLEERCSG